MQCLLLSGTACLWGKIKQQPGSLQGCSHNVEHGRCRFCLVSEYIPLLGFACVHLALSGQERICRMLLLAQVHRLHPAGWHMRHQSATSPTEASTNLIIMYKLSTVSCCPAGASASDYTGGADSMDVDQTGATGEYLSEGTEHTELSSVIMLACSIDCCRFGGSDGARTVARVMLFADTSRLADARCRVRRVRITGLQQSPVQ